MSKMLLVTFAAGDLAAGAGIAASLGLPLDLIDLVATDLPADALAGPIASLAGSYSHIAAVSSMRSKDVMARVAGILDAGMVTDVIAIESPTVFKRPIVAGTMVETVETLATQTVITFRPAGFTKGAGQLEATHALTPTASSTQVGGRSARGGARPELTQAKVVVSGGRPLKDAGTFESVIGGLADALGGAVGATRAAVDSGIAPNELQVGQTGKIVAPDLYIAAGISGSTQHMAGIKDSKVIVAINKDPDAPIFEFADLGLVADLYDAIPEIRAKLGK